MHRDFRRYFFIQPSYRLVLFGAAAALCGLTMSGTSPSSEAPHGKVQGSGTNFAPVVEKVMPSVVTIFTSRTSKPSDAEGSMADDPVLRRFFGQQGRSQKMQGLGSGVIVNSLGLILTSNHVVDDADKILVGFGSEKREYTAKKIGSDPGTDLAVLKIEGRDFPAITFANSDRIKPGEVVLAIGSPFGLTQTVTSGIISATGRG